MGYQKGSITLSARQDTPLLLQVLHSRFVTHDQLFEFMLLGCYELKRASFNWRVRRLVEGELFVTGRLKDVIIIRGRNYFPEDIEATVRSVHAAFQSPNRGAALGCDESGVERLIVLQEIDRRSRTLDVRLLKQEIRRAVALQHELQVDENVITSRRAT